MVTWDDRPRYYTLDEAHQAHPCDMQRWIYWFEVNQGGPLHMLFKTQSGDVEVSTVFLGIDHNFSSEGPPLLFETMVFRNGDGDEMMRASTYELAQEQHREMVQMCISKAYL
jgi:hypothetical protein